MHNKRPDRPTNAQAFFFAVLFVTAGCAVQLPSTDSDPRVPPTRGGFQGGIDAAVVEYHVQCRGCDIEYTTPSGRSVVEGSNGFTRRVRFTATEAVQPRVVTLRAKPAPGAYIVRASISVDGREVAKASRSRGSAGTDEPVTLTAPLPGSPD